MRLTEATESAEESIPHVNVILPSIPHERLLTDARTERQPVLIPPRDATINSQRAPNPTSQIVMLVPIAVPMNDGELWLEILQHPSGGPASQRGYLRFAAQMADMIAEFLKTFRMRLLEHDQEFLLNAQRMIDRIVALNRHGDPMAKVLACIRDNVKADHVFWIQRRSQQQSWRLKSIAGIDKIDRRVSGINIIEKFANSVDPGEAGRNLFPLGTEESFNADASQNSAGITTAEQRQFHETFGVRHGVWFDPHAILPERPLRTQTLIEELLPDTGENSSFTNSNSSSGPANNALIIIWASDQPPPVGCSTQSSLLFRLGRNIVEPSALHGHGLAPGFINSLRTLATKWGLFLSFMAAMVGVMAIPVPLMLESSAVLVPIDIEELYAPANGVVEQVLVEDGQLVTPGTPLVKMQSNSLSAEREKTLATIIQHEQRAAELDNRLLRDRT